MTRTPDVLTFGESMASFRSAGPLAAGGDLSMQLAGAESNVAIALARLGHRSAWVGRVAGDELGEYVLRRLRGEGVDIDHVVRDAERPTGLMFLEQRTADLTRVQYHRVGSAGSALSIDDLRDPVSKGTGILHITGITPALSERARQATLWAAETASAAGIPVCLDVNYRARLWSRDEARSVLAPLASYASIVVASHDELDLVGPAGADEAAVVADLRRRGVETVLVKLGSAGAHAHTRDGVQHAEALAVTAVDTVGAGDAFAAGYLSGRLDGLGAAECLRRAVTLGAFAVSTRGDWEGLPRRDELSLLDGHETGNTIR
ncbi:MAG: PfkB protein [Dactylosporangium sp.]|nr:PfkB protein [Dactylosporangium sp.]